MARRPQKSIISRKEIHGVTMRCGDGEYTALISKKKVPGKRLITEEALRANPKEVFLGVAKKFYVSSNRVLDAFVHTALKP